MAAKANSLIVLLAILLLAIPLAVCAPVPHASMPAMHCTDCCPTNAAPTPALCCTAQPQANLPQLHKLQSAPLVRATLLDQPRKAPVAPHSAPKPQFASPPPRQTPLRI